MAWKELVKPGTTEFKKNMDTDSFGVPKNPNGVGENLIAFFDFEKEIPEYRYYHVSHGVAGDSVTGDTEIRTLHSGGRPIEELFESVDNEINGKEFHYPDDLFVLSFDWKKNQSCYKRVKYVMRHKCEKRVFRVSTSSDEYVDVTEDHSVMCYNSRANPKISKLMLEGKVSPFKECKPEEIKSSLVKLKVLPRVEEPRAKYDMKELYEFFGFFVGDGSLSASIHSCNFRPKDIGISFGLDTDECVEKIIKPLQENGFISNYSIKNSGYDVRVYMTSDLIVGNGFVCENGKKSIPKWMENETSENIRSFLRGYFSADGGVSNRGGQSIIRLSTTIKKNAKIVKDLLSVVGIGSSVFTSEYENRFKGKRSGTFSSYVVIRDRAKFRDDIGFCIDRKNESVKVKDTDIQKKSGSYGFSLASKRKVEEISYGGYVYDMEVEDTHVFFGNDFLLHNTDSIYLKLPKSIAEEFDGDLDQIVKFCDEVGELTDEYFPEFAKKAFNCPDDRLGSLSTEREVVSDKSFFVTKKRYAMHIIDDEGKRVDKLKIMGLEVKKSDTSVAVKEFLMKVINMVIDGCGRRELMKAKNEFKREFFTMGVSEIGVPMPATKLTQYMKAVEADPSMKGVPYHYKAALFYNSLCGKEDREIFSGEKFYVCNIKHPDSKYIAVPLALNTPPEFIDDIVIDHEAMWAKANKKIENYMKSLGWDLKSRMESQAADLLGM